MKVSNNNRPGKLYPSGAIKEICIKAGADDAGVVDIDREALKGGKAIPIKR